MTAEAETTAPEQTSPACDRPDAKEVHLEKPDAPSGSPAAEEAPLVRRPPLDNVPLMHTYTSEHGVLYVYDIVDGDWKERDFYEGLVQADLEEESSNDSEPTDNEDLTHEVLAAAAQANLASEEDVAMNELLASTEGMGEGLMRADAPGVPGTSRSKPNRKRPAGDDELPTAEDATGPNPQGSAANSATPAVPLTAEQQEKARKRKEYRERKKLKRQAGLFVKTNENPNVYVSGLPPDVTLVELVAVFQKGGIVKIDPATGESKIRIYRDEGGACKGDALVSYANGASVELAVKFLHEHELRPGCRICVQQADFDDHDRTGGVRMSKDELRAAAESKKKDRAKLVAARNEVRQAVSWGTEVDDGSGQKIIVLRHMFSPEEADSEGPEFYAELAVEIKEECEKLGRVKKVTPIEGSSKGVVCIKFADSESAEECIRVMDGRFFGGQTVEAFFYDGKTDLRAFVVPSSEKTAIKSAAVSPAAKHNPAQTSAAAAAEAFLAASEREESSDRDAPETESPQACNNPSDVPNTAEKPRSAVEVAAALAGNASAAVEATLSAPVVEKPSQQRDAAATVASVFPKVDSEATKAVETHDEYEQMFDEQSSDSELEIRTEA